ncbi:hypothetical protein HDR61_01155 [bacterium]|nr:hypothetical protein [bacterium]
MNKTITVIFYLSSSMDKDDTNIKTMQITPAQLFQMQQNVENAHLWKSTCPNFVQLKYKDDMVFMGGDGKYNNTTTKRIRKLEINNMFWHNDARLACGECEQQNTDAKMRHCANNLCAGKCQDPFMRGAIGTVLFPIFYANENQK